MFIDGGQNYNKVCSTTGNKNDFIGDVRYFQVIKIKPVTNMLIIVSNLEYLLKINYLIFSFNIHRLFCFGLTNFFIALNSYFFLLYLSTYTHTLQVSVATTAHFNVAYGNLKKNLLCFPVVWSYLAELKANLLWAVLLLYYCCLPDGSTAHCLMVKDNNPEL